MSTREEFEARLFWGFVVLTLIIAAPSKLLYYAAPPLFLVFAYLVGSIVSWARLTWILLSLGALAGFSLLLDYVGGHHVNVQGAVFSLVMILPMIILFSFDQRLRISDALFRRIGHFLCYFIFVQTAVSVLQIVLGRRGTGGLNGDYVSGTLGLFDVFSGSVTISQVFFTFNIFCMVMFLLAGPRRPLVNYAIGLGLLCCVFAQSGHQTIAFITVLLVIGAARGTNLRNLLVSVLGAATLFGLVAIIYPSTTKNISAWFDKTVTNENSPKRALVDHWVRDVATPKTILLGTGMGQFSGRGALFSSGYAVQGGLPSALLGRSDYFDDYVAPQIDKFKRVGESSAIAQPYFGYLTLVSEYGVPFALLVIGALGVSAWRGLRRYASRRENPRVQAFGRYQFFFIAFLLSNAFIENYFEFVQALLLPVLLFGLAEARIRDARAETVS